MKRLPPDDYGVVAEHLGDIPLNTLFARTVVAGHLPGRVYVDDTKNPKTFLVKHPYGMSLLFGEAGNEEFNVELREHMVDAKGERNGHEWLQIYPLAWKPAIESMLDSHLIKKNLAQDQPAQTKDVPDKIIEYTRVNFEFRRNRYLEQARLMPNPPHPILRTTGIIFTEMPGQVIPRYFWRDAEHFSNDGIGFSMLIDGLAASTAFAAFTHGTQLEMGIETAARHRGMGYAVHVCKALIDYCLENGYEPIWSCRLENTGSFNLAGKLGFEPVLYAPYYQLPNHGY